MLSRFIAASARVSLSRHPPGRSEKGRGQQTLTDRPPCFEGARKLRSAETKDLPYRGMGAQVVSISAVGEIPPRPAIGRSSVVDVTFLRLTSSAFLLDQPD